MKQSIHSFDALNRFDMTVRYIDDTVEDFMNQLGHHVHAECEIYINISGDVSFVVEQNIYPIKPGNIIITHPGEYHHCIYHGKTRHRHFWILFSPGRNEKLLELFFARNAGSNNLFELDKDRTGELTALCHKLCEPAESVIDKYFCFFRLLKLIESAGEVKEEKSKEQSLVAPLLDIINKKIADKISVSALAKEAHISISTLERLFRENLGMLPTEYITKIRLTNAARLLCAQCSVTEAAEKSGFSDVSRMIELFKKNYGTTPLKYKKRMSQ